MLRVRDFRLYWTTGGVPTVRDEMCDYCDCRSHRAIASLSEEHGALVALLDRLERAASARDHTAAAPIVAELTGLLDGHARREEHGVFAEVVRAEVDDTYVQTFLEDHDRIHALIRASAVPTPDPAWDTAVGDLVARLSDHILREETDLFPVAHQLLSPAQWDAVDDVHARLSNRRTGVPA